MGGTMIGEVVADKELHFYCSSTINSAAGRDA